jgi:hypothetical protein
MRNRDEVPNAGADDLPAPEIAVSHPPPREAPLHPAPEASPGGRRELTVRAVATAMLVAVIVGGSYPYVVLKIGYGPNISVVSAFFGYLALAAIGFFTGIRGTRWENNLVQTAGTAAGEAGFMCVVLAAMDMLNARPELGFSVHLSPLQIFGWLSVAGMLGVLLAVPLRRHYIDDEDLPFADGTAAGETMLVLDLDRTQARARVRALGWGLGLSALAAFFRDFHFKATVLGKARQILPFIPGEISLGAHGAALRMGTEVSLLSFGSGLLVGARVTLSMGLGMVIAWVIAPPVLTARHIVPDQTYALVLRWVMWPATGLMVAGGLTALALKWKLIVRSFTSFKAGELAAAGEEFPLKYVASGVALLTVALCVMQHYSLQFPVWLTLVSDQRAREPHAGRFRRPRAGQHAGEHDRLGHVGHGGRPRRASHAGLQGGEDRRRELSTPHHRAAHGRPGRLGGGGRRLSGAARPLRFRRQRRPRFAHQRQVGGIRGAAEPRPRPAPARLLRRDARRAGPGSAPHRARAALAQVRAVPDRRGAGHAHSWIFDHAHGAGRRRRMAVGEELPCDRKELQHPTRLGLHRRRSAPGARFLHRGSVWLASVKKPFSPCVPGEVLEQPKERGDTHGNAQG